MQIAEVHNNKLIEDLSVGSMDFSFNEQMKRRQLIKYCQQAAQTPMLPWAPLLHKSLSFVWMRDHFLITMTEDHPFGIYSITSKWYIFYLKNYLTNNNCIKFNYKYHTHTHIYILIQRALIRDEVKLNENKGPIYVMINKSFHTKRR